MSLVSVKIKGIVVTGPYGTLNDGTILRTSAEFARHLVTECNAAEYVEKTEPKAEATHKVVPARKGK